MKTLYHWTDQAGYDEIIKTGFVDPTGPLGLAWFTEVGARGATCIGAPADGDLPHRFVVNPGQVTEPWLTAQKRFDVLDWYNYELADRARPDLWHIATGRISVDYAPRGA